MGFKDDKYRGKESKYEYAAEGGSNKQQHGNNSSESSPSKNNNNKNKKLPLLTYSLKETLWSTDTTYLDALQHTEDLLPANRQMILLWCERNGIPHVEASALNGRGVDV